MSPGANVQAGSAHVQTGSANVQTGSANVQTGSANVQTGSANVQTGSANVHTGSAKIQTGSAKVQTGSANVQTGSAIVPFGGTNVPSELTSERIVLSRLPSQPCSRMLERWIFKRVLPKLDQNFTFAVVSMDRASAGLGISRPTTDGMQLQLRHWRL